MVLKLWSKTESSVLLIDVGRNNMAPSNWHTLLGPRGRPKLMEEMPGSGGFKTSDAGTELISDLNEPLAPLHVRTGENKTTRGLQVLVFGSIYQGSNWFGHFCLVIPSCPLKHRCPFWFVWVEHRDSWFTWWFNHLRGKPIYFP